MGLGVRKRLVCVCLHGSLSRMRQKETDRQMDRWTDGQIDKEGRREADREGGGGGGGVGEREVGRSAGSELWAKSELCDGRVRPSFENQN